MEQKLLNAIATGLHCSGHISGTPTRFYSNAQDPWFKLSNLYECDVTVDGKTFPSAEHAYQALQKNSRRSVKKLVEGWPLFRLATCLSSTWEAI